jgi:uncharacterized metal-binding protein YceD (DUF177 family)
MRTQDLFKIYVHRLKDGHIETISERLAPEFLGIDERELAFKAPILLKGEASVTNGALVLRLSIETEVTMPCAVCNQEVQVNISISRLCHTEQIDQIRGAVFDYEDIVREAIVLEVPFTAECNRGDCPERASLAKYIRSNK